MNAASTTPALPVGHADIAAAAARLEGRARRTPVMTSRMVDERSGAQVYFKCENFQRMGAFKFRGAYNALAQLTPEQKRGGVLAYEPAPAETELLGYRRGDVDRAVAEVVAAVSR